MWIELIGTNDVRSSRQTLSGTSAIKEALNMSTVATALPKSSSTTFAVAAPVQLVNVARLGVGIVGKSSSHCDVDKVVVQSPRGEQTVFYMNACLDSNRPDAELLPGTANCVKLTLSCVTGDLLNAGTDGAVFVCMFDALGASSGLRCLRATESRNLFERKQTDVFELFINPPLGPIKSLNVLLQPKVCFESCCRGLHSLFHQGIGSDWYLEKFILSQPLQSSILQDTTSRAAEPDIIYFAAHTWLNSDFPSLKIPGSNLDVVFNYSVTFNTADCLGAGTDASVSIEFEGENGKSGFRSMEQSVSNQLNLFERGKTNTFAVKLGRSLGVLKNCSVLMKASGLASVGVDWCLDTITIVDETSKQDYVFPVFQWLSPSDGVIPVEASREINECVAASLCLRCFCDHCSLQVYSSYSNGQCVWRWH
jgi:hypothetical protein